MPVMFFEFFNVYLLGVKKKIQKSLSEPISIILQLIFMVVFAVFLSCISENRIFEKGEVSLRLGDYSMAIRFFEEVLNRKPDNFDARLGMGKALMQKASALNNDSLIWIQALTHLEAARSINPESNIEPFISEAWVIRSRILLKSNKDTLAALKALTRAIDYNPQSAEALNISGIIYFRFGELEKSLLLFNKALLADSSRSYTHFNIGMVRWASDDFKGAFKAWNKALLLDPDNKEIVNWYILAEKKLKEQSQ